MLGIACALYDEAFELIKPLSRQKINAFYHYTGKICNIPVSVFLTKPGLRKNKGNFIKWVRENQITTLLQTGYCGSLTSRYRPGDVCHINKVSGMDMEKIFQFSGMGDSHHLLTVDRPILTVEAREDLQYQFSNADLMDMEAWHICQLLDEEFPQIKIVILKIIGDVPGEDSLMKQEVKMRSFFREHSIKKRIKIVLDTGLPFFELYYRKRKLQKILNKAIHNYILIHFKESAVE